ncbi:MAG: hypothetical protein NC302_08415 [Bacteroidales bacterium]|nr:hypothetical protein [Bacteroidales bacterium]MCM1415759.1 hypothetical protein [bacterium]MCM1424297.1 hypothetical protein [bacterium]
MDKIQTEKEDIAYRQQVVNEYRPDVEKMARYLPWLESKMGTSVQQSYTGSGVEENSISFPVYDSTLMSFVKEAQRTKLMDRNYRYVYSRCRLRTLQDELRIIEKCTIREMDVLKGILSKYVMGGMTKGRMWSEAVETGVFLSVIKRMKANLDFWDTPVQTRVVNVRKEEEQKTKAEPKSPQDTFF